MGLAKKMTERLQAAGRLLAVLAALTLAGGFHPPHAEAASSQAHPLAQIDTISQAAAAHSHFAVTCLQAELDHARDTGGKSPPAGHADCTQVCAPFVKPQASALPAFVFVAPAQPADDSFRHFATAFDPPPPRRG